MLSKLSFIFCVFLIFQLTLSAQVPTNCSGTYNENPITNETPQLIEEVPHGQKYQIPYDDRQIFILNLTGNAYEMGYAYGQLFKEELSWIVPQFLPFFSSDLSSSIPFISKIPKFAQGFTAKLLQKALQVALNLNYAICKRYIPQRFDDEMNGIADASGQDIWDVRGIQMFPELIKAACSMLGIWGPASDTGKLYQLRALDFDTGMPFGKYPSVVVYHSTEEGSYPFANIGWVGMIGAISGYGQYAGISEKQGNLSDPNTTRFGKPWNFALRDVLQFTKTIDESLDALRDTKRTCSIYVGVGSKTNNTFRIITQDADMFDAYDDHTWYPIFSDPGSPQIDGIIYKIMHSTYCARNLFLENYGHLGVEAIRQVCALDQTGDAQIAIYDFMRNYVYVAYPIWDQQIPAFTRPTAFINLNPFFTGSEDYEQ